MKRAVYLLLAVAVVAGLTGCVAKHGRRSYACTGASCEAAGSCDASCDTSCGESCDTCTEPAAPARPHRSADGPGFFKPGGRGNGEGETGEAGPPTGAVTYPYYTTRGPRDFLARSPASIGP
jgi:hypothetical protein